MPGDDLEVAIAMKDGGILADRYGRDEAIEPVPDPLSGGGAHTLDGGRSFPRLEATDGQEIQWQETAPDLGEFVTRTASRQELHHDRFGDGDGLPVGEERSEPIGGSVPCAAEQVDPHRGVDEDHEAGCSRSGRSSS